MRHHGDALPLDGRLQRQEIAVEAGLGAAGELGDLGGLEPGMPVVLGGIELQQRVVHQLGGLAQPRAALRHSRAADGEEPGVEEMGVMQVRAVRHSSCR